MLKLEVGIVVEAMFEWRRGSCRAGVAKRKRKRKKEKKTVFVRKEEREGYVSEMSLTCGMPMLSGR